MRSRFSWAFLALLSGLACSADCLAACTSTEACLRDIAEAQGDVRSIEADFVQVKHLGLMEEPLISRGHFTFKQPDRVRLEILSPEPATILIDGRKIHIPGLTEDQQKAIGTAPIGAMFGQLAKIFRGDVEGLREDFDVTAREENGVVTVDLVPRRPDWKEAFRSIQLRFSKQHDLESLRLEDELGDSLEVTLSNVKRNRDVPDALFESAD